jgi:hypothetical protein
LAECGKVEVNENGENEEEQVFHNLLNENLKRVYASTLLAIQAGTSAIQEQKRVFSACVRMCQQHPL